MAEDEVVGRNKGREDVRSESCRRFRQENSNREESGFGECTGGTSECQFQECTSESQFLFQECLQKLQSVFVQRTTERLEEDMWRMRPGKLKPL